MLADPGGVFGAIALTMKKQTLIAAIVAVFGWAAGVGTVFAQETGVLGGGQAAPLGGFYGGVALRDSSSPGTGLNLGTTSSEWAKFALPGSEDSPSSSLMFGGYRFSNNISVEAAVGQSTGYALRLDSSPQGGLSFAGSPGITVVAPRSWNLDAYTSYNFGGAFALYGRMGYLQQDPLPNYFGAAGYGLPHALDGLNYGVGVRYDVSPALGLKLEFARYGRFGADSFTGSFQESDQLRVGVQYRF
jgi:opacity protein-like surface antigen